MQILSFDSSALTATVAIWRDGVILSELSATNSLNHSVRLLPMIDEALCLANTTLNETEAFAVSAGPGSFTGVRIGISTLKGLAYGTGKLCAPVSTLEALGENERGFDGVICAVMDARRGEFYNALFTTTADGSLKRLTEDRAITSVVLREELEEIGRPVVVCGDGAHLFVADCRGTAAENFVRLSAANKRFQRAASVACVGAQMLLEGRGVLSQNLAPLYLRASGAERKREKREN